MWNIFWAFWFFVNAGYLVRAVRKRQWLFAAISLAGAVCSVYNMA